MDEGKSQASRWLAVVNDLVAKLLHASRASGIPYLVHRPFDFVLLVNFPFVLCKLVESFTERYTSRHLLSSIPHKKADAEMHRLFSIKNNHTSGAGPRAAYFQAAMPKCR